MCRKKKRSVRDTWELARHAEANPPYQNLYFHKILRWFIHLLWFEKYSWGQWEPLKVSSGEEKSDFSCAGEMLLREAVWRAYKTAVWLMSSCSVSAFFMKIWTAVFSGMVIIKWYPCSHSSITFDFQVIWILILWCHVFLGWEEKEGKPGCCQKETYFFYFNSLSGICVIMLFDF